MDYHRIRQCRKKVIRMSERSNPKISQFNFLSLKSLSSKISQTLRSFNMSSDLILLDLGCGEKPYLTTISPLTDYYIGLDLFSSSSADIYASATHIPIRDEVVNTIISTQVLEHVFDPSLFSEESYRVLSRNGNLIMSTHGVWPVHSFPKGDYWRWTNQGLHILFDNYDKVTITNCGGAILTFFQLINLYIYSIMPYFILGKVFFAFLNILGFYLDKIPHINKYLPELITIYFLVGSKHNALDLI